MIVSDDHDDDDNDDDDGDNDGDGESHSDGIYDVAVDTCRSHVYRMLDRLKDIIHIYYQLCLYLHTNDLLALMQLNKSFCIATDDNIIWKPLYTHQTARNVCTSNSSNFHLRCYQTQLSFYCNSHYDNYLSTLTALRYREYLYESNIDSSNIRRQLVDDSGITCMLPLPSATTATTFERHPGLVHRVLVGGYSSHSISLCTFEGDNSSISVTRLVSNAQNDVISRLCCINDDTIISSSWDGTVLKMTLTPDGRIVYNESDSCHTNRILSLIAVGQNTYATGSLDCTVKLWDTRVRNTGVNSCSMHLNSGLLSSVYSIASIDDSGYGLAIGCHNQDIYAYDVRNANPINPLYSFHNVGAGPIQTMIPYAKCSRTGQNVTKHLAIGSRNGSLHSICIDSLPDHSGTVLNTSTKTQLIRRGGYGKGSINICIMPLSFVLI